MCRYRRATCHNCGKTRYIASVCKSRKTTVPRVTKKPENKTKWVEVQTTDREEVQLFTLSERAGKQIIVQVQANGQQLSMELDTGAVVSIPTADQNQPAFLYW